MKTEMCGQNAVFKFYSMVKVKGKVHPTTDHEGPEGE
jgi:hypothetical protein